METLLYICIYGNNKYIKMAERIENIGLVIKNERLRKGLTQEELGLRVGVGKAQISKYIEGYVKSVSDFENADKKSFERKYKYSTLKYFHDILGIE